MLRVKLRFQFFRTIIFHYIYRKHPPAALNMGPTRPAISSHPRHHYLDIKYNFSHPQPRLSTKVKRIKICKYKCNKRRGSRDPMRCEYRFFTVSTGANQHFIPPTGQPITRALTSDKFCLTEYVPLCFNEDDSHSLTALQSHFNWQFFTRQYYVLRDLAVWHQTFAFFLPKKKSIHTMLRARSIFEFLD